MFITSNIYSQIDNDYMMKKNKTNKKIQTRNKKRKYQHDGSLKSRLQILVKL